MAPCWLSGPAAAARRARIQNRRGLTAPARLAGWQEQAEGLRVEIRTGGQGKLSLVWACAFAEACEAALEAAETATDSRLMQVRPMREQLIAEALRSKAEISEMERQEEELLSELEAARERPVDESPQPSSQHRRAERRRLSSWPWADSCRDERDGWDGRLARGSRAAQAELQRQQQLEEQLQKEAEEHALPAVNFSFTLPDLLFECRWLIFVLQRFASVEVPHTGPTLISQSCRQEDDFWVKVAEYQLDVEETEEA